MWQAEQSENTVHAGLSLTDKFVCRRTCIQCMHAGAETQTHAFASAARIEIKLISLISVHTLAPCSLRTYPWDTRLQVNFNVKDTKGNAEAAICSFCQEVACVCRCARALVCVSTVRAVWLVGDRPIHLSGVIVALWLGLGVSMHSVISQIRVIHLLCVSVRARAALLITALIHFPQSYSLHSLLIFSCSLCCTTEMLCFILIIWRAVDRARVKNPKACLCDARLLQSVRAPQSVHVECKLRKQHYKTYICRHTLTHR